MQKGTVNHKNPSPPDNATLNDELKKDIYYGLNCVQIGIIESFDKDNQTATVQMALKRVLSEDLGIYQQYPLLVDVPCFILSGGLGSIEFPISKGDECILLFNDREIDNWFEAGGIAAPDSIRAHSLSDAIALVGLKSLAKSISGYITDGVRLKYGTSGITLKYTEIDLSADEINTTGNVNINYGYTGPKTAADVTNFINGIAVS